MQLRAGQIVGSTYHTVRQTGDLRKAGETEERITAVASWRDAPTSPTPNGSQLGRGSGTVTGTAPEPLTEPIVCLSAHRVLHGFCRQVPAAYSLCRHPAVPPELANRLLLNSS